MFNMISLVTLLSIFGGFVSLSEAGAVFNMQLLSYNNHNKDNYDGSCCDTLCWTKCDALFVLCLDALNGDDDFKSCQYGRYVTQSYGNIVINFGSSLSSKVKNPLVLDFDEWPGGVRLKVQVLDHDSGNPDDLMEKIFKSFNTRPSEDFKSAPYIEHTLRGTRTKNKAAGTMILRMKVYCLDDFYGPKCDVQCYDRNDTLGHYFCDPATGNQTCNPGWADVSSNCTTPTDECLNADCQNGGTCVDGHLNYTCVCSDGYFGDLCQFNVCDNITCQHNGQCVGFGECSCQQGFSGEFCEVVPEKQDSEAMTVPFWAAIVLLCLVVILLVDVALVSCHRCRRSPDAMKQPLVQDNPTYDANLAIDNFQHINGNGTPQNNVYTLDEDHNVYDSPAELVEQQPSTGAKLDDGAAYPGDSSMLGSSPPSSPPDTSDTKPFALDFDEESKDNVDNTRLDK